MGPLDEFERYNTQTRADLLAEQREEDAERAFTEAAKLIGKAREIMADFEYEHSAAWGHLEAAAVEFGL